MQPERMTVSLDDFLRYLLKKWKLILIMVLFSTAFFLAASVKSGERIEVPASEEYLFLKEQEQSFEEYMEHSVMMQMNPLNIYEITIQAEQLSDWTEMKAYVDSPELWEQWSGETDVRYLSELIICEESGENRLLVKLRHSEETSCRELAAYVTERLSELDAGAEITSGKMAIIADEAVSDSQMWYQNRLRDITGQLDYAKAGYVIEISKPAAVALGAITGALLAVILLFVRFLLGDKLRSNEKKE